MKKTIALSLLLSQLFHSLPAEGLLSAVDTITKAPKQSSKLELISQEKEKAITQAEQVKIKTIALAKSKESVAIAKAIKTHSMSEIEALKIQALAKADAMSEAETKITQAKIKRMKRKILETAKASTQEAQGQYNKTIALANEDVKAFVKAANVVNGH